MTKSNDQQCRFLISATPFWQHDLIAYFSPEPVFAAHHVTFGRAAQKSLNIQRTDHSLALRVGQDS